MIYVINRFQECTHWQAFCDCSFHVLVGWLNSSFIDSQVRVCGIKAWPLAPWRLFVSELRKYTLLCNSTICSFHIQLWLRTIHGWLCLDPTHTHLRIDKRQMPNEELSCPSSFRDGLQVEKTMRLLLFKISLRAYQRTNLHTCWRTYPTLGKMQCGKTVRLCCSNCVPSQSGWRGGLEVRIVAGYICLWHVDRDTQCY